MNKFSKKEYVKYVEKKTPNSSLAKDIIFAFLVGGTICILGQLIIDGYKYLGLDKESSGTATSITLILLSCILTGFGIYDKIAKHAGAGTIVPITGFANAVVSPAMEFKSEGMILGLAAKMFVIAGPVIVYGIMASVLAGVYYYIISLI